MKKIISLALALAMTCTLVACGQKEAPASSNAGGSSAGGSTSQAAGETDLTQGDSYVIRVAHSMTDQSSYHKSVEQEFKKVIEEKTGGRITVEIYPSSQLGGERQAFEGVGMGTIEMTLVNSANVANVDSNYALFDFPFLFDSTDAAYACCDGEVGDALKESIQEYGYVNLGFGQVGYRYISNSVRPITQPSDLKGIKLRCMENPIHIATWTALGASPTPMALNELFTAMQQHTVDGQENPPAIIYDNKFNEVNEYLSCTGHVYHPLCYVVNKTWFDGLSAADQALIAECGEKAALVQREMITADDEAAMEAMEAAGMKVNYLDDAQLQQFKDATASVIEEYRDWVDEGLIEKAQACNE
ncbi:MAG: DctP family TRAP transporter solute-binding subunit [Lawsonibacter sp.]|jgi:C4-dicarboxylate-binding protein DctP